MRALPLAVALQFMISAGDGLAMVALASRVFSRSHAGWAVASVFLAVSLPIAIFSPLAGMLLDRLRPRPLLVAGGAAAALVALALTVVTGVAGTLGLAAGFGLCAALIQPGLGAIVPRLAPPEGVTRANSYLQAASWGGMTAGPLLAGLLAAAGGARLALLGDAAMYAAGAAGLALLRLAPAPAPAVPGPAGLADGHHVPGGPDMPGGPGQSPRPGRAEGLAGRPAGPPAREPVSAHLRAGLTFLRTDRTAGLLVAVVGVMVAFAYLAVVAEVVLAQGVLRAGPGGYAVLVASWTAGMVVGSLVGGRLPARWLVTAALAGTVVTGAGIALAGVAAALWQAALAYSVGGLADGLEVLATRSYLNLNTPAPVAGRVFALYNGILVGAASVGMTVASGLLAPLGARAMLVLAGAGGVAAGGIGWLAQARRAHRARAGVDAEPHSPQLSRKHHAAGEPIRSAPPGEPGGPGRGRRNVW